MDDQATVPLAHSTNDLVKLKWRLISDLGRELEAINPPKDQLKNKASQYLPNLFSQLKINLDQATKDELFKQTLNEMFGYGPIQSLLEDNEISEVMVNGPGQVFIERNGKLEKVPVHFDDNEHVMRVINRIILPLGRQIDPDSPTVDARLPDGSRVNAVILPVAIDGPSITIRKFQKEKLSMQKLIELGSLTDNMAELLRACVIGRLNIIISGGTGSGKTTLLNVLSTYIPENERIVTIEDAAELQLQQEHVVRMETKSPNVEGRGGVTIRDLVRNSLRMRPDRIVVGEVRGGEALDMLQAMNTGHDGSLTTIHANSPRDALSRLETLVLMAGFDLPLKIVRQQVSSAVDLIVQQTRFRDGTRKITAITEVAGMEGDTIVQSDIFKFEQTAVSSDGKVIGASKPTGIRPLFYPQLEAAGYKLGAEVFGANIAEILAANRNRK